MEPWTPSQLADLCLEAFENGILDGKVRFRLYCTLLGLLPLTNPQERLDLLYNEFFEDDDCTPPPKVVSQTAKGLEISPSFGLSPPIVLDSTPISR